MSEEMAATAEAIEQPLSPVEETAVAETPTAEASSAPVAEATPAPASNEDEISYHAVEKEGNVTAIWEMQGPKHIRTIDPRSNEGKQILALFESAA